MSAMRKRSKTLEAPLNRSNQIDNVEVQTTETQKISVYEQSRDQRIKENKERMQKLGILDLSLHFNSTLPRKRAPKNSSHRKPLSSPVPPSGPTRRSSRLQNTTPVSYTEVLLSKKTVSSEEEDLLLERGSKPEVYTEEHEKLLGSTEKSWTLFVDGCGSDGKRIYDPVKGKTCHQCRQKTLGHRTKCSKCDMVQGQFCGDCLYMRYGEHVLEAKENPNWVCPVCRGICNCSLCRQAKGWPPTGALYRKISSLGFKSVAHYLIQTRRGDTNAVGTHDTINQVSAKRSLPFTDVEAVPTESPQINDNLSGSLKPQSEDKVVDSFKGEGDDDTQTSVDPSSDSQPSAKRPLPFSRAEALQDLKVSDLGDEHPDHSELQPENTVEVQFKIERDNETLSYPNPSTNQPSVKSPLPILDMEVAEYDSMKVSKVNIVLSECQPNDKRDEQVNHDRPEQLVVQSNDQKEEQVEEKEEKELHFTDKEDVGGNITLESSQSRKSKKKRALAIEPTQDSIAGRLKQRRGRGNDHNESPKTNEEAFDLNQASNNVSSINVDETLVQG